MSIGGVRVLDPSPTADWSHEDLARVEDAVADHAYISLGSRRTDSVHELYRYPGRFSPGIARSLIQAFSKPGDLVIDPFVGGGTTAIEAQLLGRRCLASDINSLAVAISRAKTTIYGAHALEEFQKFIDVIPSLRALPTPRSQEAWRAAGYWNNINTQAAWPVRNILARSLEHVSITSPQGQLLLRCSLLRTAQWALDMRKEIPSAPEFRQQLLEDSIRTLRTVERHRAVVQSLVPEPQVSILQAGLPGLASIPSARTAGQAQLVVTSPPYPRVYVNYHRWKVRSRRETPAPYWLANVRDGQGMAYYTMGGKGPIERYMVNAVEAFSDLRGLLEPSAIVAQVIGFSDDVESQLSMYLEALGRQGYAEVLPQWQKPSSDGRLWRAVPSRRWWVTTPQRRGVGTTREVVLVHRLAY